MLHITCNVCTRDLPDMYALSPRAYISGKSLVPMLQLLHIVIIDEYFILIVVCHANIATPITFQKFMSK